MFNFDGTLEQTIKLENGAKKDEDTVISSENDNNDSSDNLHICMVQEMKEKIKEGLNTPLEECLSEDEVDW